MGQTTTGSDAVDKLVRIHNMDEIRLSNGCLSVELADEESLFTRFCRSLTVRQITDAQGNSYLTREHPQPGEDKDGFGLAQEFGIDGPVGYGNGAHFLKPGVGWLTGDENRYSFMKKYPLYSPGKRSVEEISQSSVTVCWESGSLPDSPYACEYRKTYQLEGNTLRILTGFDNTGSAPITQSEYCHNFLAINQRLFPEGYTFTLLNGNGDPDFTDAIHFPKYPGYAAYPAETSALCGGLNGWRLANGSCAISERVDFQPCKFAVWGMRHVVSPELFIRFTILPGEHLEWTRTYYVG